MHVVNWINKQAGKIADNFTNYKFYVKSTPDQIDSSTRLFLHVYSSREEEAHVPCVFKWYRIRNGITTEAMEFKGNTFICEPADVGSILQA